MIAVKSDKKNLALSYLLEFHIMKFLINRKKLQQFELLDLVAKKLFLTKGIGVADDKLTSFEFALRDAGIAGTNIVLISSIFPPQANSFLGKTV